MIYLHMWSSLEENTVLALLQSLSNHFVTKGEHTYSSSGPASTAKHLFLYNGEHTQLHWVHILYFLPCPAVQNVSRYDLCLCTCWAYLRGYTEDNKAEYTPVKYH